MEGMVCMFLRGMMYFGVGMVIGACFGIVFLSCLAIWLAKREDNKKKWNR